VPLFKITGQGLSAIAVSVALLWACLLGTRAEKRRALVSEREAMRQLDLLRKRSRPRPVNFFSPHRQRPPRPVVG